MPLIIVTGFPCSGKTRRTTELKDFFEKHGKEVHVVDENKEILKANFEKNDFYNDARKEKHIRGLLKSEVSKLISPRNVVILDGSNYIKGYRYELYCVSKSNHSTQCTVFTLINKNVAWDLNLGKPENRQYTRNTFDGLVMRYEEPDCKNRWDSPLFTVMPEDELAVDDIFACLFEKKAPAPNLSTQNAPLSSTNFLYDLNKIVREITKTIINLMNSGCSGEVAIPGFQDLKIDLAGATLPKVISLSRQYINYSKTHTPDIRQAPQLYIQYLRTNLNQDL